MINTFIQILLSIFLVAIMAFICYSVYNKEYVNNIDISTSTRKTTKIFSGILNYADDENIDIETYDKSDIGYLDINPSINQNGGAEYSYNFWLYFDIDNNTQLINTNNIVRKQLDANISGPNYRNYKYLILFYKGEKQISYLNNNNNGDYYDCNHKTLNFDDQIIIKNPLVKIRNDGKQLVIDYNNINYPDSYNSSTKSLDCDDNTKILQDRNKNKFGIQDIDVNKYKKQFNMITIVFKEQADKDNILYKNNANCKIYFNKYLLSDRLAEVDVLNNNELSNFNSRVMKSNFSKLHINPAKDMDDTKVLNHKMSDNISETPALQMSDLTYFNYALNQSEIDRLYNIGFNKYRATFAKKSLPSINNYPKGNFIKKGATQI